ncbi:MAG: hypothetical protein KKB03_02690 [Nanoarchaeota archaeon]|nr:hypothetical protein [Nanoarchaeota archaeon]MBU2520125.1 hypothetical protein [Nanoarchaeota archaeon]
MTSEEEHRKNVKELLEDINEKIRSNLIVERQKLIGFSTSEISCNLLALLLHKKNLISPGFNVNHRFFVSEKTAKERFDFDFPQKKKLLDLLVEQEKCRTLLCYGREKEKKLVEKSIENMNKIKEIVQEIIGEDL